MSGKGFPAPFPIKFFRSLKGPLVDLRTPKEYSQGHWPGAQNIPLFSNEERAEIGKTYKINGKEKSILLGLKIISPKIEDLSKRLKRIKGESDLLIPKDSPNYLKLYCWRGGMRSASVAWLAYILDLNPALLLGGYKSYRNWILNQFHKDWPIKLVGGKTGTGKTSLLLALESKGLSIIDLEGLANHRGSSFGSLGLPSQPSNEQYENKIGELLEVFKKSNNREILIEAESANLGKCRIPFELYRQMKNAVMIEINRSEEERISELVKVYGEQNQSQLKEATLRISKRLGPQRTAKAIQAIQCQNWSKACAEMLDYYDRYYERDLSKIIQKQSVDLSGLSSEEAVEMLVKEGHIYPPNSPQY